MAIACLRDQLFLTHFEHKELWKVKVPKPLAYIVPFRVQSSVSNYDNDYSNLKLKRLINMDETNITPIFKAVISY